MIDVNSIVEQLIETSLDKETAKDKIKIILSHALEDQINDISNIIYKYENQWAKTKQTSLYGTEDNDSSARLIRLLFNLIHDDVRDIKDAIKK